MANIKDVTVYIGRFNPFHLGHAYVLERALKTSKLVIVLVGSVGLAREATKNPFTYEEREIMIQDFANEVAKDRGYRHAGDKDLPSGRLLIRPIRNHPSNNVWIKNVQEIVKNAVTSHCYIYNEILTDIYITGSDRDDSTWYLNAFPQWKKDLVTEQPYGLSATSVRKIIYESALTLEDYRALTDKLPQSTINFLSWMFDDEDGNQILNNMRAEYEFIQGYKKRWDVAPYPVTFQTADAVVIQSGHVLVVERAKLPGKGLWALPGGFVNQNETIQSAAIRELTEETGLRLAEGKRGEEITKAMLAGSIRAKEIFDDPNRSARGRTITCAYLFRLDDEKPLPKVSGQNVPDYESGGKTIVETADAFWVPLEEALSQTNKWFEDHHQILEWASTLKD